MFQIERTAKSLDQRDRASVACLRRKACFFDQIRGKGAIDDTQHFAHDRRTTDKQEPYGERHSEHPLTHRSMR
jgi:hypothetical protein